LFLFRVASRSAVMGVPLAVIGAVMVVYWNRASRWMMLLVGLVLLLLALQWTIQSGLINSRAVERSLSLVTGSESLGSNSRWRIWEAGIGIFLENLMGVGPGNEGFAYLTKGIHHESHNLFMSALVQLGLVGFGILVSFMVWVFIQIRRIAHLPLRFITMALFFYWFLNSMKISGFETRVFWYLALVILIFCIAGREKGLIVNSAEQELLDSGGDSLSDPSRL
jgi:hypothetical protein